MNGTDRPSHLRLVVDNGVSAAGAPKIRAIESHLTQAIVVAKQVLNETTGKSNARLELQAMLADLQSAHDYLECALEEPAP